MFPGTKYFQTLSCPFFSSGGCDRPYCHFKHIKPDKPDDDTEQNETEQAKKPGYFTAPKTAVQPEAAAPPFSVAATVAGTQVSEPSVPPFSVAAAVAGHGLSQAAADNSAAITTIPSAVVMDAPVVTTAALPPSTASPVENSSSASLAAGLGVSAASTAALTAAMGPLAALSSVLEKDKLEEMIQNAVRKVLLETGAAAAIQPTLPPQTKVEVKEEADDDIIIEYCDVKQNTPSQLKSEPVNAPLSQPMSQSSKPVKLFPLAPDTPQYIPTPIKELDKRRQLEEEEGIHIVDAAAAPLEDVNADDVITHNLEAVTDKNVPKEKDDQQRNSSLPSSLLAIGSSLQSKSAVTAKTSGKKTFSYKPPTLASDNILGDIDDMSESNDEDETPDLVGSILKAGTSSGILAGGDKNSFEEQVIKEKCKLLKKKLDKKKVEKSSKDKRTEDQCDKVTSSSQAEKLAAESESVSEDLDKDLSDVSDDTSEDDEDRKIREEQEAIENLEKKRLLLENFYKSRMKKLEEAAVKESKDDKDKKVDKKSDSKSKGDSRIRKDSEKSSKHKHKSRSRSRDRKRSSRSKDRKHRSKSKEKKHRSRSRDSKSRKHKSKQISTHKSSRDDSSSESRSPVKSRHSKSSRSKHYKSSKSDKKRSRRSSSEYSTSDYDSVGDTETDNEKSAKKNPKTSTEKGKTVQDTSKDKNIEEKDPHDDLLDDVGDNVIDEYEEQPKDIAPEDEFKLAELKIKQLLEEKMKAPTMGKYSSFKLAVVKPDVRKPEPKKDEIEDIPDVNIFLKPKPTPKEEVPVKPEIKLRSLTELTGSQSPIDPKTRNIFDNEEESFSDMIQRHQTGWMDLQVPAAAANTSMDSIAVPEDNINEEIEAEEPSEENQTSFLDALSANDKAVKTKKVDNKKRDRSKSDTSKDPKKHKDSHRSDKEKERDRHRSRDDKRKSSESDKKKSKKDDRDKDRHRHSSSSRDKHKKSTSSRDKDDKRKSSEKSKRVEDKDPGTPSQVPDTTMDVDDDIPDISEELDELPDLDADMDAMFNFDDAAGDDELQRLFNEYKPDENRTDPSRAKLNKQVSSTSGTSGKQPQSSASNKKRVAHDGADGEQRRPLHMRKPQTKTPAQAMLDRYKKIQQMTKHKEMEKELEEMNTEEPTPSTSGSSKRVAHQPRPGTSQKPVTLSQARQQLLARQASTTSRYEPEQSTAAQTAKGKGRVAHTPTPAAAAVLAKPIVTPDPYSNKVPTNVRQRYLESIIEECLKIYNKDVSKAYPRAEKEEQDCCRKANNNRMIYLNLVVNKIKKLRTEAEEAKKSRVNAGQSSSGVNEPGKKPMLTTHLQILAGKGGTIGTWSIEKPVRLTDEDIDEELMYNVMKKFILTEEQLVDNGFPRPDPEEIGKAIVKVEPNVSAYKSNDPFRRMCTRCKTEYRVNEDGKQVDKAECIHHWGRQYRQRGNRALGGSQTVFYCCQQPADSSGCVVGKSHVTEVLDYNNMRGFVSTLPRLPGRSAASAGKVFALDCEMCYTTQGNELTRVTVINSGGEVIYESLVKPDNEIVDYNTRFSGITEEDLKDVTTNITQVQAVLLMKFDAKDILIGHSLESDLKALKMLHNTVVDTSVVFPHRLGPPFKIALRFLAADHLKRIIQSDEGGHDSKEDALACLDLMKMKVKEEVKRLQKKARLQAMYQ